MDKELKDKCVSLLMVKDFDAVSLYPWNILEEEEDLYFMRFLFGDI